MRSIRKARAILEEGLLGDFARGLEEHDLSPVTARGYRHDLDRFREWIEQSQGTVGSAIALARITAVDLINYRQHLVRVERLQATTINRKVQALKKLFRWARECGQVKTDVSVDLRFLPLGPRLRPPGLTAPEVQALLRAAGETRHGLAKRNYALVTLLVETGLRVGEVCQLRRGDLEVHDRSGRVRVRAGKGRKAREVPLNSNARRALRLNLADRPEPHPEDPVFLSERGGKPLALRTVQATIAELGQRAHIRRLPVTPHLMRHTFALRYLKHNPGELLELANAAGPRVLGHHRSLCTAHRRAVGRRRGEESTLMPAAASPRQVRRSGVILPEDPSDEELARNWTLSESDQREVLLCRGEENRRRFALQLCVLRWYGRLLEPEETAPVRVANYMGAQLALPPVLFVGGVRRAATETEYAERIRRHLGYVRFHPDLQRELANWVAERTLEGMSVEEVTQQAERWLRARCVVLPRAVVFARLLATQCRRAQRGLYAVLAQQVPAALLPEMDALLEVPESSNRSHLFRLKEYPPEGKPDTIAVFLENYTWLKQIGTAEIRFRGCHPALIRQFAWAVRRNDVWHLREYPDEKRHALLACFLVEALKTILDHSIEMNDQYLIGMCRRSEHAFESDLIEARKRARRGNEQVLAAMEILLDSSLPRSEALHRLFQEIPEEDLQQAVTDCRALRHVELFGYAEALESRLSHLNRYQPQFFELPFEAQRGSELMLVALHVARHLYRGELVLLPADAPVSFVDADLRAPIKHDEGPLRQHTWQIALGLSVRDHLQSGDLYLTESRNHGHFWNLVYDQARWEQERQQGFALLSLPVSADPALQHLELELNRVAAEARQGLPTNPFAAVRQERLKLKQQDRLEVLESTEQLRRLFKSLLGRIRIEHLLREVDDRCRFTEAFRCAGRKAPSRAVLLATLIAHGTNLGISAMGYSAEAITVDMLRQASQWFFNEETLKAANKMLVDYHYHLPLAGLWGTGRRSSSDGQRFLLRQSSLLGAFYPRYFGYYDQALSVYSHLSDQLSVFSNQVISCRKHESLYVLSGLLLNDTILQPQFHHTDTGGVTDHIFALCHLLGIEFMPRIKDLPDQSLFKLDRHENYGELDCLFDETVPRDLIAEQWDQMVRVGVSLKNRVAPPEIVVERLANVAPADRLAKALTAYGRIIKTIYILRYIQDEKIRRVVQLQLNRGEARHSLARWLFFANRGEFRDGDLNEIMNKTSCLSLLCNATVVWNTIRMQKIVDQLRNSGQTARDEGLARIWPLLHEHILPNGIYDFAGC